MEYQVPDGGGTILRPNVMVSPWFPSPVHCVSTLSANVAPICYGLIHLGFAPSS